MPWVAFQPHPFLTVINLSEILNIWLCSLPDTVFRLRTGRQTAEIVQFRHSFDSRKRPPLRGQEWTTKHIWHCAYPFDASFTQGLDSALSV